MWHCWCSRLTGRVPHSLSHIYLLQQFGSGPSSAKTFARWVLANRVQTECGSPLSHYGSSSSGGTGCPVIPCRPTRIHQKPFLSRQLWRCEATRQLAADLWPRSGSGAKTSSPQSEPVEEEERKQSLHNMFSRETVQPLHNNIQSESSCG